MLSGTIPANTLTVGATYRYLLKGTISTKSSPVGAFTIRARIGPTTLTGNPVTTHAPSLTASLTGINYDMTGLITFKAVGANGLAWGNVNMLGYVSSQVYTSTTMAHTASYAVDTTVSNIIEITIQFTTKDVSNTFNVYNGIIEMVKS